MIRMEHHEPWRDTASGIKAAVEARGSQRECAAATGIPFVTLNRKLNGITPLDLRELSLIATYLETPPKRLVA